MFSRFDTIPERDRQTDGRTDGQNSYISIARQLSITVLTRDNKPHLEQKLRPLPSVFYVGPAVEIIAGETVFLVYIIATFVRAYRI